MNTINFCFKRAVLTVVTLLFALTAANGATLTNGSYVYFDAHGGTPNWADADAEFSIEWFVNGTSQGKKAMEKVGGTLWVVQVTLDNVNRIQFHRLNPADKQDWNKTIVIDVTADNLCYYATTWSTYPTEDQVGTKPAPSFTTLTKGTNVYFNAHVGGYPDMTVDGAKFQIEWFVFGASRGRTEMTLSSGSTYAATVPYDNVTQIKFWRMNPTQEYDWNSTETKNVTGDNKTYFVPEWEGNFDIPTYIVGEPIVKPGFWLIVMDKDGNNPKSYKMSDSRYRVSGATNPHPGEMTKQYYTVMLKSEWLNAGDNQFYIATDEAGTNKFAGTFDSNNYKFTLPNSHYGVEGYQTETYQKTSSTGGNFVLNNNGYSSFVFMIDTKEETTDNHHPLNVVGNGVANKVHADDDYYLIGNFENAVGDVQMDPTKDGFRRLMTKYWYKNGNSYQSAVENPDSIVYRLDVQRPESGKGFTDLYIMFAPKHIVDSWEGDNSWSYFLRPEVQDRDIDATALEGGLVNTNGNKGSTNNMCINPKLSAYQTNRYYSYTVHLNITKSTYRIEFHDAFYIAGPAVKDYNTYSNRKELIAETSPVTGLKSWNYTGQFYKGKKFLVFSNKDHNGFYFHEDGNNTEVNRTDISNVNDVVAPDKGTDFAFYNHMQYEEGADRTTPDEANAMNFPLPDGTYTIRFYNLVESTTGNPYYTIDKYCTLNNASTTYKNENGTDVSENRGGWLTYSDDVATYIPAGVTAFYAAGFQNGIIQLKQLDRVIPARTGVLLYDPTLTSGSRTYNLIPVVENDQDTRLANHRTTTFANAEGDVPNYFVDSYQHFDNDGKPTDAKVSVASTVNKNGQTYYNYFFNNKITARINGVTHQNYPVPLNFWRANGYASRKKTYLQVPASIEPAFYSNGTFFYQDNVGAQSAAKSYCFVLSIGLDETSEDSVVTDIRETAVTVSAVCYNLQGMKVAAPKTKGLYIVNGKKLFVK